MDVVGPLETFATANAESRQPLYRLTIGSMGAQPVETSLGKYGHPPGRFVAIVVQATGRTA